MIVFITLAKQNHSCIAWHSRHRSIHRSCYVKKAFLKISQNSQKNTCINVSFFIRCWPEVCNFIKKETPIQAFSGKFCKIRFIHLLKLNDKYDDWNIFKASSVFFFFVHIYSLIWPDKWKKTKVLYIDGNVVSSNSYWYLSWAQGHKPHMLIWWILSESVRLTPRQWL